MIVQLGTLQQTAIRQLTVTRRRRLARHLFQGRGPHLYMDEQKRPTPERRRLSLTQATLGRPIPKGLVLALGMKAWSDDALAEYSMSHFVFVHWAARTFISERLSSNFRAAGTNERLDFQSLPTYVQ